MSNILEQLKSRGINSYPNFIEEIRFPLFKQLKHGASITFDFPFTALAGPNGSGKTSALQAIYGCPKGYNTGDFWFSTSLDPIVEGNELGPYRYIYKYRIQYIKTSVEVINIRRKRSASQTRAENPDYWETDKPRLSDGMQPLPERTPRTSNFRSATRWNPVSKKVVYIDFKSELSAFDKCFNFGSFTKRKNIHSIQDFLRSRSKPLRFAVETGRNNLSFHSKKVTSNELLTDEELKSVSKILGKNYSSARIIEHDYFDSGGISIVFNESGNEYSEAVAGSGEVAIVSCVRQVLSAPKGSLILLDEPEVSLHPGAQYELREFLFSQIMRRGHQVVLSTHSPSFIDDLPPAAIKLFSKTDEGFYDIVNSVLPEQAFIRIGSKFVVDKSIYVEDSLARCLVEKALKQIGEDFLSLYSVKIYPGGGPKIKKDLLVNLSVTAVDGAFILLDGDQKLHDQQIFRADLSPAQVDDIERIFTEYTGVGLELPLNGGDNTDQKKEMYLSALDTYNERFRFLNTENPEELIWNALTGVDVDLEPYININCYKQRFVNYTKDRIGSSTAQEILIFQRQLLNQIPIDEPIWQEFVEVIRGVVEA